MTLDWLNVSADERKVINKWSVSEQFGAKITVHGVSWLAGKWKQYLERGVSDAIWAIARSCALYESYME